MQAFHKGEIAILLYSPYGEARLHKYTCGDVEILGFDPLFCEYHVRAPDGFRFWACPDVLRKKPQPPDWKALSAPSDAPREVVPA